MKKLVLGVLLSVATLVVGINVASAQTAGSCYVFNNDLSEGMTFGEVLELQKFLASEGAFNMELTGTFGPITKASLAQYQSKNGIQATGYFGPATRAQVNARCGSVLGAYDQVVLTPLVKPDFGRPIATGTKPGKFTLITPLSSDTLQKINSHTVSWEPLSVSQNDVDAFLEVKKGNVFKKVAKAFLCDKGKVAWCGAQVDLTPEDGQDNWATTDKTPTGKFYFSIVNKSTQEVARTKNPIKVVEYGAVTKLKLTAHLDKNKKVEVKDDEQKLTLKERKITLSWSANADSCVLQTGPLGDYDDPGQEYELPRHGTKQTYTLAGNYPRYLVFMRCADGTNMQHKAFDVTIEGAGTHPDAPVIDRVESKAAEPNELYANETAVLYGQNLHAGTKVYLDVDGTKANIKYFETTETQSGSINIKTFAVGAVPNGSYLLYASNGDGIVSNPLRIAYINPTVPTANACQLNRDLTQGSTGDDVVRLNLFLESKGFLTIPALSHASGYETAAVAAYQQANGIVPADGNAGPITRAHINANCPSLIYVDGVESDVDSDPEAGTATFTYEFDVTAIGDDVYIYDNAIRAKALNIRSATGISFDILGHSGGVTTAVVQSSGEQTSGGQFIVEEGNTERFTVTIYYKPEQSGTYQAVLFGVNSNKTAGTLPRQQYVVNKTSGAVAVTGVKNTLTVTKSGTGTGTVSGLTNGGVYQPGASATLTATADLGSRFRGWSGACTGTVTTCVVLMDGNKSVNAMFDKSTYTGVVSVIKPSAGDSLAAGQTYDVQWNYSNFPVSSHVKYSVALVDSEGVVTNLYTSATAGVSSASGNVTKTVTFPPTNPGQHKIRVTYMNSVGTYQTHADSGLFNIGPVQSVPTGACNLDNDMTVGARDLITGGTYGSSVSKLQSFLVKKGFLTSAIMRTPGTFASATQAAVAAYQNAKGIIPADGYVGPATRSLINAECDSGVEIELHDTDADVSENGAAATYVFEYDISATKGDIYVRRSGSRLSANNFGAINPWLFSSSGVLNVNEGTTTVSVQSDKEDFSSNVVQILKGEKVRFTAVVVYDPLVAGTYQSGMYAVNYYTEVPASGVGGIQHVLDLPDTLTNYVSVSAVPTVAMNSASLSANQVSYSPYSAIASLPDLKAGMTHEGVVQIQRFLNANGFAVNTSAGQPGSVGHESTYFGPATQKALAAWQASKGISPANGSFGPQSRALMSQ